MAGAGPRPRTADPQVRAADPQVRATDPQPQAAAAAARNAPRGPGRPVSTSHQAIERAAFRLFAQRGFEATTIDDIAAAVGVGRRTVFRYFESKNDIPWGRFDASLVQFERLLRQLPAELPIWTALHRAVVAFNTVPPDADPSHADRMRLIFHTPALQAHSMLRHARWRDVIARFVAERTGAQPTDLGPATVAHAWLAVAVAAYEQWLRDPEQDLPALIDRCQAALAETLRDAT